jgi:predicted dehydrogenase
MIKIGIIGMGRFGMMHAEWIKMHKELQLVAAAEKDLSRIKEIEDKYKIKVFDDTAALIDMEDIDYIVIATTNEAHEDLAIKALDGGKNVIVEKPMSLDYEGSVRMVQTAEKYKKNLFVHHSTLWDRDYLLVKDVIESGLLGEILVVKSSAIFFGEYWAGWGIQGMAFPWRIKSECGGGLLMDWGPHLITQLLMLTKKELRGLYARLQSGIWACEVEDHFMADLDFGDNTIYQIEASTNYRIPYPRWFIIGTKGTLMMPSKLTNVWDEAQINYVGADGNKEIKNINLVGHPGAGCSGGFYEDFVRFINGEKKEFLSMHMSSLSMKVIDAIRQSDKIRSFVTL